MTAPIELSLVMAVKVVERFRVTGGLGHTGQQSPGSISVPSPLTRSPSLPPVPSLPHASEAQSVAAIYASSLTMQISGPDSRPTDSASLG